MEIVTIFEGRNPREGLFSIKLEGESEDEFEKLLDLWIYDAEYFYNFFSNNSDDLETKYYIEKNLTVKKAVQFSRDEAYDIFTKLEIHTNTNKLFKLFTPLHKDPNDSDLLQSKAYSNGNGGWLRVYAIKISDNTFVITGGGVKLVKKMQEREHLIAELEKLKDIRAQLIEKGIITQDDFNSYEI